MREPLAFRMRPKGLSDIIGQSHLIGENSVITRCIKAQRIY